jgi:hypothetical protein
MIERHVVAPDIGLSGVHGTPSVMTIATFTPAGRPLLPNTVCACSSASPVYVQPWQELSPLTHGCFRPLSVARKVALSQVSGCSTLACVANSMIPISAFAPPTFGSSEQPKLKLFAICCDAVRSTVHESCLMLLLASRTNSRSRSTLHFGGRVGTGVAGAGAGVHGWGAGVGQGWHWSPHGQPAGGDGAATLASGGQMLSRMVWIRLGRSFHVDGLNTYLLDGVDEMSLMNWVP